MTFTIRMGGITFGFGWALLGACPARSSHFSVAA